jgi:hypothetical protein
MTHNPTNMQSDKLHQEVWALLPWYVNGTLVGQELQQVETHLALCTRCQEELVYCRELSTAVQTAGEIAWEPSAAHLERIFARIDAAEAPSARAWRWPPWLAEQYRLAAGMLRHTPPLMRWAFAAQGALVLLLASVLVWRAPSPSLYPTLSVVPQDSASVGQQVRLVFAEDMTERELRALLSSVGGTITGGPSLHGAYTVEIAPSMPLDTVLRTLRAQQKVRLAEPITTR